MRYLPFLLSALFACTSAEPEPDCQLHRVGKYQFTDPSGQYITIERTEERQYEYTDEGDTISVHAVEWKNDCTYRLRLLQGDEATQKFQGKKVLTVTITDSAPESYAFVARMEDMKGGEVKGRLERKK